jgi:hypothetical protein
LCQFVYLFIDSFCSVLLLVVATTAQQVPTFLVGEALRIRDLLDGLGCIGKPECVLKDFKTTSRCDFNVTYLKCSPGGRLAHLYSLLGRFVLVIDCFFDF